MKNPAEVPIAVQEALEIVLRETAALPEEKVELASASGRILSEDVASDADQPPFAKAMMDGFAVRSADLASVPATLEVVEEIPAGRMPSRSLSGGQAARIMTGAPLPEGADAVQMVEKTQPSADGRRVAILEKVVPGANVAPRGQELQSGQRVLSIGDLLAPARIGVLASVGRSAVMVRRRPRVSVVPTGDELVDCETSPGKGQIRNSNSPALVAAARRLGAEAESQGIVMDEARALAQAIGRGLPSDLLLLSGGVSMGEFDLVEKALEEAGVEIYFRKIAIRPGKPAVFGRKGRCLVFGLPGNPVSSLVIFEVFVAPALRKMQGVPDPRSRTLSAILEERVTQRPGRTAYLPGSLRFQEGRARVQPLRSTGSADLFAHSRANALYVVPSERESVEAGESVSVLPLAWAGTDPR
jgi:molybdopterin molybdotransferase